MDMIPVYMTMFYYVGDTSSKTSVFFGTLDLDVNNYDAFKDSLTAFEKIATMSENRDRPGLTINNYGDRVYINGYGVWGQTKEMLMKAFEDAMRKANVSGIITYANHRFWKTRAEERQEEAAKYEYESESDESSALAAVPL